MASVRTSAQTPRTSDTPAPSARSATRRGASSRLALLAPACSSGSLWSPSQTFPACSGGCRTVASCTCTPTNVSSRRVVWAKGIPVAPCTRGSSSLGVRLLVVSPRCSSRGTKTHPTRRTGPRRALHTDRCSSTTVHVPFPFPSRLQGHSTVWTERTRFFRLFCPRCLFPGRCGFLQQVCVHTTHAFLHRVLTLANSRLRVGLTPFFLPLSTSSLRSRQRVCIASSMLLSSDAFPAPPTFFFPRIALCTHVTLTPHHGVAVIVVQSPLDKPQRPVSRDDGRLDGHQPCEGIEEGVRAGVAGDEEHAEAKGASRQERRVGPLSAGVLGRAPVELHVPVPVRQPRLAPRRESSDHCRRRCAGQAWR
jgi:hypothetical protein